ncbi:MAG: DnaJ domain-containing protein, partial [Spirulina sp. SIO3F2]|nr:DnaJ domain-containing protein [Spirulina sp. SIO3F2]
MAGDYYQTLGIARDASPDEIKRAYRRLARKYHPDVNKEPGAEDKFKEVNRAHEVLSDPEIRARYDRFGEQGVQSQGYGDMGDVGFADIFETIFSGFGGGGMGGGASTSTRR